jgi:hypothetical protein
MRTILRNPTRGGRLPGSPTVRAGAAEKTDKRVTPRCIRKLIAFARKLSER